MKAWRVMLQSVGVVNLLLTGWGWWLWGSTVMDAQRRHFAGEGPYFRAAFWTLSGISAVFLASFVLVSVMLVTLRPRAAITHTILFLALIAYVGIPGFLWLLPHGVGLSIAQASGVGSVGVGPLLFFPKVFFRSFSAWFGYPLISILCVNVAWHRVKRISSGPTLSVKNA